MKIIWPLLVHARRHPKPSIALAVLMVLLIIGGVGNAVSSKKSSSTASTVPVTPVVATSPPAAATTSSPTPTPTLTPTPKLVTTATGEIEPNRALTPGEVFPTATRAQVCGVGYSASVGGVPDSVRRGVFAAYGIDYAQSASYELNRLVSLGLGGDNSASNLWPEPLDGASGAKVKDTLESKLHALVCSGQVSLLEAQQALSGDWGAANTKYAGLTVIYPTQPPAPAYTPPPAPAYSPPPAYTAPAAPAGDGTYTNVDGNTIPDPVSAAAPPAGATAQCNDGTYSFSQHHSGTCSSHGGVASWL
jgi:hypothetical protein